MKRANKRGNDGRVHAFTWHDSHACWIVACDARRVMGYAADFTTSTVNCLQCVYNLMRG